MRTRLFDNLKRVTKPRYIVALPMRAVDHFILQIIRYSSYVLYYPYWLWRKKSIRNGLIWFAILSAVVAEFFGVATLLGLLGMVGQFMFAAMYMVFQFAIMFIFLSSTKNIEMLPGDKGAKSFEKDWYGQEHIKNVVLGTLEMMSATQKEAMKALGASPPSGAILTGPPGTGKTLISRAVAGEAGVPFFSISGSEFVEMFVGVGASRVRDLFSRARQYAPCIVFIDEIDAVGRHRGAGIGGGNDEREQTLNQILVEMDGFDERTNVIVIAATNRPDVLDTALLRPGRFDRRVTLSLPDVREREDILKVHLNGKPVLSDVNVSTLAKQTHGFSGADLANLANEAAILAARNGRTGINLLDMEESIDRVLAGPARRSRQVSEQEKEIVAYHEAGHALVASNLPKADPVHKVTIVPRGTAGGYTRLLPEEDRNLWSKGQFEAMLAVMMGGQAAEEIVFGDITTGASNDLQNANGVARRMVTEYGMSTEIGPRTFETGQSMVFMGKEMGSTANYSDAIAEKIDSEIGHLLTKAQQTAKKIIGENRTKLTKLATRLISDETLEGPDLHGILDSPPDDAPALA